MKEHSAQCHTPSVFIIFDLIRASAASFSLSKKPDQECHERKSSGNWEIFLLYFKVILTHMHAMMLISRLVYGECFSCAAVFSTHFTAKPRRIPYVLGLYVKDKVCFLHNLTAISALPLRPTEVYHF